SLLLPVTHITATPRCAFSTAAWLSRESDLSLSTDREDRRARRSAPVVSLDHGPQRRTLDEYRAERFRARLHMEDASQAGRRRGSSQPQLQRATKETHERAERASVVSGSARRALRRRGLPGRPTARWTTIQSELRNKKVAY